MFHFSPRNALLPSAALVALLGLGACGGGDSDSAPADTTINASGAAAGAAAGSITTTTTPPATTPPPVTPAPTTPGAINVTGLTNYTSTSPNTLVNFAAATPNTVVTQAITGLTAGDTVVGIDVRPVNGTMYAFARADSGGAPIGAAYVYTLNPTTGAATARLPITGVTFDASTSVSVDFNPAADRMRVVTFQGQSVSVDVTTGIGTLNGPIGGTGFAAAVAYTNSAMSATAPAATVLYRIDNQGAPDDLTTVTPATGAIATTVGPIGLNLVEVQAFDIGGATNQNALAALRTTATGAHTLYRINLATGATTPFNATAALSLIGTIPLVDIAIRP